VFIRFQSDQVNDSENRFPKQLQQKLYQRYFKIRPNEEKSTRWARVGIDQVLFLQPVYTRISVTKVRFIKEKSDLNLKIMWTLQKKSRQY